MDQGNLEVAGRILTILGVSIGVYYSCIVNTTKPRARAYMIKCAVFMWVYIAIALLILPRLIPSPFYFVILGVSVVVALSFVPKLNKKQMELSRLDLADQGKKDK